MYANICKLMYASDIRIAVKYLRVGIDCVSLVRSFCPFVCIAQLILFSRPTGKLAGLTDTSVVGGELLSGVLRRIVSAATEATAVDDVVNNKVALHNGEDVRRRRSQGVAAAAAASVTGTGRGRDRRRDRRWRSLAVSAAA